MGKYHFLARSLLSARSEPATKIRRVLELRSPSGGRDQQSRLQRSIACIGRGRFARTAAAGLLGTAWKPMDKSFAASIARGRREKRS